MSQNFDALRTYCRLPAWLTDERQLKDYWLLQLGGTHGNEVHAAEDVERQMTDDAYLPGRLPMIVHPLAVERRVRHIGARQVMSYYPGSRDGQDIEDRIAASVTWLVGQLPPNHVVLDMHNNDWWRFVDFGRRTSPAAFALASMLGHTNLSITPWSPFRQVVPRSLLNEEIGRADTDGSQKADEAIRTASLIGESGLRDYYHDVCVPRIDNLRFFENVSEVRICHDDGSPDESILAVLPELEAQGREHPAARTDVRLELSRTVCTALGLPYGLNYSVTGHNYQNNSTPIDNKRLGLPDTMARRLSWGLIRAEHPGPQHIDGDGLLYFGSVTDTPASCPTSLRA